MSQPSRFIRSYLGTEFITGYTFPGNNEYLSYQPQPAKPILLDDNKTPRTATLGGSIAGPQMYYCLAINPTEEELKKSGQHFLKMKNLYAIGWKLSSEGHLELTGAEKTTILNNVYVMKKGKPQQMGMNKILIEECGNADSHARTTTLKLKPTGGE